MRRRGGRVFEFPGPPSLLPGNSLIIPGGEAEDSRFPAAATASPTTTRPRAPPEGCKAAAAAAETSLVNNSSSNPRVHCQRDPQVLRRLTDDARSSVFLPTTSFGCQRGVATIILGFSSRGPSRKRQRQYKEFFQD